MKRYILSLIVMLSLCAYAQSDSIPQKVTHLCFGYLDYEAVLHGMPDYAGAMQRVADLRKAYEEELNRVEDDFNKKYEAFLEGQKDFPRTILLKRQTELQDLMQRNIEFRNQGLADLKEAEKEALAPLRARLNEVLAQIAHKHGYAFILNTGSNACPFIDPEVGEDVTSEVNSILHIDVLP